jgi:hypothetical protein
MAATEEERIEKHFKGQMRGLGARWENGNYQG